MSFFTALFRELHSFMQKIFCKTCADFDQKIPCAYGNEGEITLAQLVEINSEGVFQFMYPKYHTLEKTGLKIYKLRLITAHTLCSRVWNRRSPLIKRSLCKI